MNTKMIGIRSQKTMNGDIAHQNKILSRWITENYGKRCPTYERGCVLCEAWEYYDALKMIEFNKENIFNFFVNERDNAKMLERLRKKQADIFVEKIKDCPEALGYLKGLVR